MVHSDELVAKVVELFQPSFVVRHDAGLRNDVGMFRFKEATFVYNLSWEVVEETKVLFNLKVYYCNPAGGDIALEEVLERTFKGDFKDGN